MSFHEKFPWNFDRMGKRTGEGLLSDTVSGVSLLESDWAARVRGGSLKYPACLGSVIPLLRD